LSDVGKAPTVVVEPDSSSAVRGDKALSTEALT
jgi:hypothetical protein